MSEEQPRAGPYYDSSLVAKSVCAWKSFLKSKHLRRQIVKWLKALWGRVKLRRTHSEEASAKKFRERRSRQNCRKFSDFNKCPVSAASAAVSLRLSPWLCSPALQSFQRHHVSVRCLQNLLLWNFILSLPMSMHLLSHFCTSFPWLGLYWAVWKQHFPHKWIGPDLMLQWI